MIPKSKSIEIVEELNTLISTGGGTEFSFRPIKSKIEKLKKANPSDAFSLQAVIFALKYEEDEARKCISTALSWKPADANIKLLCAAAIGILGFSDEASEMVEKEHENNPGDIEILNRLIERESLSSHFIRAAELLEKLNQLSRDSKHVNARRLQKTKAFMHVNNMNDEDVSQRHKLALEICRKQKIPFTGMKFEVISDGDSTWLDCEITIGQPIEVVSALNQNLAEVFAADPAPPNILGKLNVMFGKIEKAGDGDYSN